MKRLALIGSKEFAKQICSFVEEIPEYSIVGYYDDFESKGTIIRGLPVLGNIAEIINGYEKSLFDYVFLAAGYSNFAFREKVFNQLKGKVPFANLIMPSVKLGHHVKLGEGIFIGSNSVIADDTIINDNVFIHGHSEIGHDNIIGSHTYISGRFNSAGFSTLGNRNFFGICVIVSDHITICDDVWIGLGCIVTQNITEAGKYMVKTKLYKID